MPCYHEYFKDLGCLNGALATSLLIKAPHWMITKTPPSRKKHSIPFIILMVNVIKKINSILCKLPHQHRKAKSKDDFRNKTHKYSTLKESQKPPQIIVEGGGGGGVRYI